MKIVLKLRARTMKAQAKRQLARNEKDWADHELFRQIHDSLFGKEGYKANQHRLGLEGSPAPYHRIPCKSKYVEEKGAN